MLEVTVAACLIAAWMGLVEALFLTLVRNIPEDAAQARRIAAVSA